ncbi:Protein ABHD14A [Bagarius yarrelli]|uniref:Protein ABHD14A n=1 Tax=Bagarius yarrelli TaxID=175774 RepID=A0A556VVF3_BAGYA|nr:Protein ABHD14A [Bagarius yarrelli]
MSFLRNRVVVLLLVLLFTVLLYLLLPSSIRQSSTEPNLEVQRTQRFGSASPSPINITVRTGQIPSDPPLFFREALPVDSTGRQVLPRLQVVLLHASESVKSEQSRVDLLKHFLEALGVHAPVLITPSMSGHYALPFLQRFSDQLRAFVPIAPVATRTLSPQQYQDIQTPTLIVVGELDTNLGSQSLKNLQNLPHHSVVKLSGARHACYMDKPREFHQALLHFLNTLD